MCITTRVFCVHTTATPKQFETLHSTMTAPSSSVQVTTATSSYGTQKLDSVFVPFQLADCLTALPSTQIKTRTTFSWLVTLTRRLFNSTQTQERSRKNTTSIWVPSIQSPLLMITAVSSPHQTIRQCVLGSTISPLLSSTLLSLTCTLFLL